MRTDNNYVRFGNLGKILTSKKPIARFENLLLWFKVNFIIKLLIMADILRKSSEHYKKFFQPNNTGSLSGIFERFWLLIWFSKSTSRITSFNANPSLILLLVVDEKQTVLQRKEEEIYLMHPNPLSVALLSLLDTAILLG